MCLVSLNLTQTRVKDVASSEICSSMLTALLISFWFIIWCECPLNVEALTVSEAVRMEFVELAKVLSCMFVVFLS